MKIIRQSLRQPIKLISGILVVSLAVSILTVCFGQAIAAGKTEERLETIYSTVALPTIKYNYSDGYFVDFDGNKIPYQRWSDSWPEEITDWLDQLVQTRGDLVKTRSFPGLASAYLPELVPDNVTQHNYQDPLFGATDRPYKMEATSNYASAMLEIVLDEIGEPVYFPEKGNKEDGTEVSCITRVTVELIGTIQSVVSLEEGYDDPTGRKIHISMELPSLESLDALQLELGQRYLVYSPNYLDGDWALRGIIASHIGQSLGYDLDFRKIDTNKLEYLSDQEIQAYLKSHPHASAIPIAKYVYDREADFLREDQVKWKNAVVLTIRDEAAFGEFTKVTHDKGSYSFMDCTRYLTDESGNKVQITEEEWQARYQIPTVAPLDGTVEEFLAAHPLWRQTLEQMEVNHHAFPIIGVEKLGYIAEFARQNARIVEGRDFTEEELESGAKVCILSQSLAAANGLSVGDTIRPHFYNYDYDNPNQGFISKWKGTVNPAAYRFTNTTEWAGTEEYTIVGLYRQNNAWGDIEDNIYSFTPNTVFVPHSSVTSDMDYGDQAFFMTLVLQTDTAEEFYALVAEAGYEGLLLFHGQEYITIVDSLMNYRGVAQKAAIVGLVVYGVILLLFLVLFPGSQSRSLSTMHALGAERGQRITQVFMSSAGILVPGSILGCLTGMLLWGKVISWLAESAGEAVTLKMEPLVMLGIALAQLALALALTLLLALPMSRDQGIRKRK